MKNILLLTTFYPNPFREGSPVCYYFVKEWEKMGYNVIVIHYRSMFPKIYLTMARLFPKMALKYVGNRIETDIDMNIEEYIHDGTSVYSVPIFKYIPHGKYSSYTIKNQVKFIENMIDQRNFMPDAIIGHFYNPQLEIISKLKKIYPNAHTCVSLHEGNPIVIKKLLPKTYDKILSSIDYIGFRSYPIKWKFDKIFGERKKYVMCFSGTSMTFLETPSTCVRNFTDDKLHNFIYVGQYIARKYPRVVVEALYNVYGSDDFDLYYVGQIEQQYADVKNFVDIHQLTDHVHYLGQLPRESIINAYDKADCFIMISRYEIFGLVYLEAMARGCIVIASRNEGMDGIIKDGENGFLCEAGNTQELQSIIERINNISGDEKKRISENGRKTASLLTDNNVAKSYINQVIR